MSNLAACTAFQFQIGFQFGFPARLGRALSGVFGRSGGRRGGGRFVRIGQLFCGHVGRGRETKTRRVLMRHAHAFLFLVAFDASQLFLDATFFAFHLFFLGLVQSSELSYEAFVLSGADFDVGVYYCGFSNVFDSSEFLAFWILKSPDYFQNPSYTKTCYIRFFSGYLK